MKSFIPLNIKFLVEKNKLSQKEFGELFGLQQAVISAYIRGVSNPQIQTLIQISDHFDISIDNLLKRDLSVLPKTEDDVVVNEDECKICALYENMIKDKERIINSLERENAALRGLELPDEGKSA